MQKGMPRRANRRLARRAQGPDESGFTLVEVLVAVIILMIVVISFSYLLVDSLSTALLSKQREAAASLASDVIENARAIGFSSLTAAIASTPGSPCVLSSGATALSGATFSSPPILTAPCFQGYSDNVIVDTTSYLIILAASENSSATEVSVSVVVTWSQGSNRPTYTALSQIGA